MRTGLPTVAKPKRKIRVSLVPEAALRAADHFLTFFSSRTIDRASALPALHEEPLKQLGFTFAMIALAAKITRLDGVVTREEFLAFREVFPLEDRESEQLRRLFALAWEDAGSARYYAQQITTLYPGNTRLARDLLMRLCAIAQADGPLTSAELRLLSEIGQELGFARLQLARLLSETKPDKTPKPHQVLGVSRNTPLATIKAHYRALMRLYHPDRLAADVHYPEARAVAERKAAAINAAYRALARQ